MHKAAINVAEDGDIDVQGGGSESKVFGHLHVVFRDWSAFLSFLKTTLFINSFQLHFTGSTSTLLLKKSMTMSLRTSDRPTLTRDSATRFAVISRAVSKALLFGSFPRPSSPPPSSHPSSRWRIPRRSSRPSSLPCVLGLLLK